jgi:hypothetical protein
VHVIEVVGETETVGVMPGVKVTLTEGVNVGLTEGVNVGLTETVGVWSGVKVTVTEGLKVTVGVTAQAAQSCPMTVHPEVKTLTGSKVDIAV